MPQRVTQSGVITTGTSLHRTVTQVSITAVPKGGQARRTTQTLVYGVTKTRPPVRATTSNVTAVSRVALDVVGSEPLKVSQVFAYAVHHQVPDLTWLDCVRDIRLPECISDGVIGGPMYFTDAPEAQSGYTGRTQRWRAARSYYSLRYDDRDLDELHELLAFWRVVRGRAHAFLVKDQLDHTSSMVEGLEPRAIRPDDQLLGIGDAVQTAWPLLKHYDFYGETAERRITRPVPGTVRVAVNGVEVSNWSVSPQTGIVTFTPRHSVTGSDLAITVSGSDVYLDSNSTDLSGFEAGEAIQVAGFTGANVLANTGLRYLPSQEDETYTVAEVVSANRLRLTNTRSVAAPAGDSVTVNVHPAPRKLDQITAGYAFDVPVRFKTDELPMTLDAAGQGALSEIELVETVDYRN